MVLVHLTRVSTQPHPPITSIKRAIRVVHMDKRVRCDTILPARWHDLSKPLVWHCASFLGYAGMCLGPMRVCRRWRACCEAFVQCERWMMLETPEHERMVSGEYPKFTSLLATQLRILGITIPWSPGMLPLLSAPHLEKVIMDPCDDEKNPVLHEGFHHWIRDSQTAHATLDMLGANLTSVHADLLPSLSLCKGLVRLSLALDKTMEPLFSLSWMKQLPPSIAYLQIRCNAPTPTWALESASWHWLKERAATLVSCTLLFQVESFGWQGCDAMGAFALDAMAVTTTGAMATTTTDTTMATWLHAMPVWLDAVHLFCFDAGLETPRTRHEVLLRRPPALGVDMPMLTAWLQVPTKSGGDWSFVQHLMLQCSSTEPRVAIDLGTAMPNLTKLHLKTNRIQGCDRLDTCFHVDLWPPSVVHLILDDSPRPGEEEFTNEVMMHHLVLNRTHAKLKSMPALQSLQIQVGAETLAVDWKQRCCVVRPTSEALPPSTPTPTPAAEVDRARRLAWWRECFQQAFAAAP